MLVEHTIMSANYIRNVVAQERTSETFSVDIRKAANEPEHKQNATQLDPVDIRPTTTMDTAKSTGATRIIHPGVFYMAGLLEHLARVFKSHSTT